MRAFFALATDDDTSAVIERWRDSKLPPFLKPVARINFHLTLAFLGEISERQLRDIEVMASSIRVPAFILPLDSTGYWPKQQTYYLAPTHLPDSAFELVSQLKQIANRLDIKVDKRKYQAHLTLARRCELAPPEALTPPDITLDCSEFCLFESTRMKGGVRYDLIDSFDLC